MCTGMGKDPITIDRNDDGSVCVLTIRHAYIESRCEARAALVRIGRVRAHGCAVYVVAVHLRALSMLRSCPESLMAQS